MLLSKLITRMSISTCMQSPKKTYIHRIVVFNDYYYIVFLIAAKLCCFLYLKKTTIYYYYATNYFVVLFCLGDHCYRANCGCHLGNVI
jgi:hypothetical protein